MKRVTVIVLDSFGIGAAPDAEKFGDAGVSTVRSVSLSDKLCIPTLKALGLGNIEGAECVGKTVSPLAAYGKMREISAGKDTTVGHWELAGVVSKTPFPTYPDGFPDEIIEEFVKRTGKGVLCNKPYSGTEALKDFGEEHLKTGKLIVYTSADSVFQIAANEKLVPPEKLYEYCKIAREILVGEHCVARVIARPFVGDSKENFTRTANRRDFSAEPPKETVLDALKHRGIQVTGVGKIGDIFAYKGLCENIPSHSNIEGMEITEQLLKTQKSGLIFTNLVEFDSHYGHRQDKDGYANALSEFDKQLAGLLPKLTENDVLIITADHGCDPSDDSTDHTREYVPLLIYGKDIKPTSLGTLCGFSSLAKFISHLFSIHYSADFGEDFHKKLLI